MRAFRRGSIYVRDCAPWQSKLDRNLKVRILVFLETMERNTKLRGKRCGALGLATLEVARALLLHFSRPGKVLAPSYAEISRRTRFSRGTIAKALEALERVGVLSRQRRIERAYVDRVSPITGDPERILTTVQATSLLRLQLPASRFVPLSTNRVHSLTGQKTTGAIREELPTSEASNPLDIGSWKPLPRPSASPDWRSSARMLLSKARAA